MDNGQRTVDCSQLIVDCSLLSQKKQNNYGVYI